MTISGYRKPGNIFRFRVSQFQCFLYRKLYFAILCEIYRGTMTFGWCFICAFVALINKVCLQGTVEGFIGSSVVLPCSSDEHDHKLQDINVLWRHKGGETFYNLIEGKDSVAGQNPRYKNRAQTFPEEYERGNFSIKLINLTHADEGEFSCFITHTEELRTIQLILKESTEENGNKTTEENEGSQTQSDWINISISVFTVLLALTVASMIAYFMFRRRKRSAL